MIAIIKYNAGNTRSVQNVLDRLGYESTITDDAAIIRSADKVIFPGVGEASSAMKFLKERGLDVVIRELKQPVLGICLGLQLLCAESEEGNTKGIGVFPNKVKRFENKSIVPHMGWNNVQMKESKLLKGLQSGVDVYFVHSYFAELSSCTTSVCDYIEPFSASLEKDNFYATQFHPEKSAKIGALILKNFLEL